MAGHVGGAPVPEWELEIPDTFWDNFVIDGDPKVVCWEWTGKLWRDGHARWNQHNWGYYVHRVTFGYYLGEIPDDLVIDHLCMVKHCGNPYHLELVTSAENTRRWAEQTITHCPQGHPYSWVNTTKGKSRRCMICKRQHDREYEARNPGRQANRYKSHNPRTGTSLQKRRGNRVSVDTRLGYLIDRSGLLAYEVAALIGLNPRKISAYISGKENIPPHIQTKLADLFGVPPEVIVGVRQSSGPSGGRAVAGRRAGPLGTGDLRLREPAPGGPGGESPLQDRDGRGVPESSRTGEGERSESPPRL